MAPPEGGTTANDSLSLRRHQRLSGSREFNRVFQDSHRSADRFFTVLYRSNSNGEARLGFAISKKCVGLSVARNRLRRVVKESFRHNQSMLGPVDIVVMAQTEAAAAGNPALRRSLEQHWNKIGRASTKSNRSKYND